MDTPLQTFIDMHAEPFVRAGGFLLEQVHLGLGTPAIVCATLGAELSLKAILARHGIKWGREHSLKSLLGLVPPADRDAIIAQTRLAFPDFDAQLDKAANAFVDWRYVYESKLPKELNALFVTKFARAAAERLETIRGHALTLHLNEPPSLPLGSAT
jgi:hypothetical protein